MMAEVHLNVDSFQNQIVEVVVMLMHLKSLRRNFIIIRQIIKVFTLTI